MIKWLRRSIGYERLSPIHPQFTYEVQFKDGKPTNRVIRTDYLPNGDRLISTVIFSRRGAQMLRDGVIVGNFIKNL